MEQLRDFLRRMIFGRRGCDPRRVGLYRLVAVFDFTVGLAVPVLLLGPKTGIDALPLAVYSLAIGVPSGVAVGRWLVPAGGLLPDRN